MPNWTGQCKCGAVRYVINGEIRWLVNCHCNMCREMNGSAFSSYAVVREAELAVSQGRDMISAYTVFGTARKHYCSRCGTPLFNTNPDRYPGAAMLYLGTLICKEKLRPGANIYCESMLEWVDTLGEAPRFDQGPE